MDPDRINCMILCIHVDKIITIPSHAIQQQTSVSARYGIKKKKPQKRKSGTSFFENRTEISADVVVSLPSSSKDTVAHITKLD